MSQSLPVGNSFCTEFPEKLAFLFEHHPYKVLYGGRDGVKSWSIAQALLLLGTGTIPGWSGPIRVLCGRETMDSIRESVHQLLADQIKDVHETIGSIGYFLIGAHAFAALYHHYALGDNTLLRMLPGKR